MDSLTYFHSKNVNFYVHYSYSLKVMALSIFQNLWVDTSLKVARLATASCSDLFENYIECVN